MANQPQPVAPKGAAVVQQGGSALIEQFFSSFARDIDTATNASGLSAQAFRASLVAEAQRSPDVLQAIRESPETVLHCCVQALQNGLLVGAAHGEAYLIPRNVKRGSEWAKGLTLMTGYKGLMRLVQRCDGFLRAHADVIYEEELDGFSWDRVAAPVHKWRPVKDKRDEKIVAAYAWIERAAGDRTTIDAVVLDREQLLARRDRSDAWKAYVAGKAKSNPWATDFAKMCRKTPIRDLVMGGTTPIERKVVALLSEEEMADAGGEVVSSEPLTGKAPTTRTQALAARLGVQVEAPAAAAEAPAEEVQEPNAEEAHELKRQEAIEVLIAAAKGAGMVSWTHIQAWLQDETGRAIGRMSDLTDEEMKDLTARLKE